MSKRNETGFTLLEVMVALAVVSTALVMVASLRNRDIVYHGEVRHMIQATLLAEERMTVVEVMQGVPDFGESSDRFEEPFDQYEWLQTVLPTVFDFAREVHIIVRWGPQSHESVELTNYVVAK
jgi:general secretion pathway protein I